MQKMGLEALRYFGYGRKVLCFCLAYTCVTEILLFWPYLLPDGKALLDICLSLCGLLEFALLAEPMERVRKGTEAIGTLPARLGIEVICSVGCRISQGGGDEQS